MSHPFGRTCHKHGITHDLFTSGNPGNIGKLSHPRPETQITGDRNFTMKTTLICGDISSLSSAHIILPGGSKHFRA
jgi:hypothetical protein